LRLYRGDPSAHESDLNLGMIHFAEQDFHRLSEVFAHFNQRWGTKMMFCIYPAQESNRDMIMNVRDSPKAPSDLH
jgi:hypothetical protein